MIRAINHNGRRYGRLLVESRAGSTLGKKKRSLWNVLCDCGTQKIIRGDYLQHGTLSCGCLQRETTSKKSTTHGATNDPRLAGALKSFYHMRDRCLNPDNSDWYLYGGRGVTIDPDWLGPNGFRNFLADLGPRGPKMSLDRIDPHGNYEPGNCRWATWVEQAANQRRFKDPQEEIKRLKAEIERLKSNQQRSPSPSASPADPA